MKVYLSQILDQEIQARCCALFSRSHVPFSTQLENATKDKSSEFAKTYVHGYGHNSINDCGNVCFAIERVSMIAAKFIEDYPLFNGQESSTRYIPFDIGSFEDNVVSPFENDDPRKSAQIALMNFYKKAQLIQYNFIKEYNKDLIDNCDPKILDKAIKAKCFDILRGYLPAGAKTQLAWVTNFRQAIERIEMILRHPINEIRLIGDYLKRSLIEAYPGASYGLIKDNHITTADEYFNDSFWSLYHRPMTNVPNYFDLSFGGGSVWGKDLLINRHESKKLPQIFDIFNDDITINASIDYGSWRDIHRHRNCKQMMPILKAVEFEDFYFDNLAPELKIEASKIIHNICHINKIYDEDFYTNQYFIPMGFKVLYTAKWSMSQIAYVVELRSKPTVHHTVRRLIDKIIDGLGDSVKMKYCSAKNVDPLKIDISRGKQ